MGILDKKLELIKLISNLENDKVIDNISEYLKSNLKDFWSELSEHEREEIELGLKQLDNNEGVDLADYLKRVS